MCGKFRAARCMHLCCRDSERRVGDKYVQLRGVQHPGVLLCGGQRAFDPMYVLSRLRKRRPVLI
jgi:hypothetical protein